MKKYTDKMFLAEKPNQDRVVAVRIKDGEFYFLAWMVNAERYRIQYADNHNGYLMDREYLLKTGDIRKAVQKTGRYMDVLYRIGANGNSIDKEFADEYERFLSLFTFGRFSASRITAWYGIIGLSENELRDFGGDFHDGDYIFIMDETRTNEDIEAFKQKCYEAYQLEWMMSHGISLAEALNTVGSNFQNVIDKEKPDITDAYNILYGEGYMYASGQAAGFSTKEEFLNFEFLSATYMDRLLSLMPEPAKKKVLWKEIVEGGAADEQ